MKKDNKSEASAVTRQKAEALLLERERQLATLMNNLPGMAYRCKNDQNWTMEFVSDGVKALTGYSASELVDNKNVAYADLIHPADWDAVKEQIQVSLKRKEPFILNYRLRKATGEECWVWEQGRGVFDSQHQLLALEGFVVDITERKRAEEALVESEAKYRTMVTQSPDGIFIIDLAGKFLSVNKSMCDTLKYTEEEFLSMKIWEIVPEQYQSLHKQRLLAIMKGESLNSIAEYDVKGKDGMVHAIEVRSAPFYKGKELIGFQGTAHDITEQNRAEKVLRESEEKYHNIFENMQDVYFETTIDGIIIEVSPSIRYITKNRFKREDVIGRSIYSFYANPLDRQTFVSALKENGYVTEFEIMLKPPDGLEIPCSISSKLHFDAQGKPSMIIGNLHDITERKLTEKALTTSETRYRRLFESTKDGILILDADTGRIMDVNPFLVEMLGYSHKEFTEKTIWEIGFFKDIIANQDKFLELQQQEYVRYDNLPLETASGRKINVEFVSNVYLVDKKKVIQCNIRDITDRKRVEKALIDSESSLRMLVQTIPDLIWTKDANGTYLSCNAMFERFFGAREVDIMGKTDYDFVDRELADFFRENDRKAMEAGKPSSNEEWITFADDKHRAYFETIKAPIYNAQNSLIGVLGIGRDITARKSAEQKVKESEKRFKAIFSQAPIGIALIDVQGQLIIANVPLSEMVGYSCEELSKKKFVDFTYPEDIDKDLEQFNDLINGKISMYNMEKRYVHKNGNLVWANLFVTILRDENGNFLEILGMAEDITERKKTEKALQESMERYKKLTLISPVGIFHTDEKGVTTFVNPMWVQISGLSFDDALGDGWLNAVHPDDKEKLSIGWKEATQNQKTSHTDYRFVRPDGSIAWVMGQTIIETNTEGKIVGYIGTITDITERKQAEETLKDNNIFLQTLLNAIPAPVFYKDLEGRYIGFNKAFELFFGKTAQELAGKTVFDINPRELAEIYHAKDLELFQNPGAQVYDSQMKDHQGVIHDVVYHKASIMDSNNHVNGLVGVILDISERKQSEKVLNDLIDKNPMSIQIMDKDGFTLKVNTAYSVLFSATPPPNFSIFDDLQNKGFGEYILRAKKGEVVRFPDIYYNVHDVFTELPDKPVWIRAVLFSLTDPNSIIERFVFMHEDITERKRAEKEIAMLAQSLRSVNELVSITDNDNKIFFVNDSFLKTYGYGVRELIGKSISVVQSQKNAPEQVNEILQATILGEWKGELYNRRKDGSEFPIYLSTSIIKDKDGKSLGLIGVATDITERKRNEQTLMKLSSAIEQTVDLIVITDRNGIIEYVNRAFEELTGYSSEEVLGKTPRILKSSSINQEYYEGLWKTILSGKVFRAEILNKKRNGDLYYEDKSISPILDKNGNITHFVSTGLDITKRKLAEKELIAAKEKAEENDKLKTAFLQNISHEIRTPMNAIVGFSELMELEIDEPDKLKYYTKVIRQRSDDLLEIINELLDISRIEAGQLIFKSEQVDLKNLFEELHSLFSAHNLQIEKSSIILKVKEIPSNFISIVSTDVGKLKQIFSNLIHNALKFTSKGKIEFGFHSINNNKITFFVSDSGSGISENMKDLIFERFRKSADESVYVQDGIGLGLAIVKGLLKLFDGTIRVESELNLGSTFFFTIPYIPIAVKKETEMLVKNQKYEWSNFTLLIVEDDKFNIAYFVEILNSTGIKLLIGETGNQAISLFTNNQNIDLVLMDIKLPDMSGYEVTKEFKRVRPETPIIAQTAYAAEADRQKAFDDGCDDYITKPIKRDIFLETIGRYLTLKAKNK